MRRAQIVQGDTYLALIDLRNTPTQGMSTSPMERLMSRQAKTLLPTAEVLLKPKLSENIMEEKNKMKEKQRKYYNLNAKDLSPLKTGDIVRMEPEAKNHQWTKGRIASQNEQRPRSYNVETETRRVFQRNRRHLKLTPTSSLTDEQDELDCPSVVEPPKVSQLTEPVTSGEVTAAPEKQGNWYQTCSGRTVKMPSHLKLYVTS